MIFDVYVSKPRRCWAIQWTGRNAREVEDFLREFWASDAWVGHDYYSPEILKIGMTYCGEPVTHRVERGQWIMKPQWDREILILTREEFEPNHDKEKL